MRKFVNTCDVVMYEGRYPGLDRQCCGLESEAYCDDDNCQAELCSRHAVWCEHCIVFFCPDHYASHLCKIPSRSETLTELVDRVLGQPSELEFTHMMALVHVLEGLGLLWFGFMLGALTAKAKLAERDERSHSRVMVRDWTERR